MELISIIMPIYNVEKYLEKAIESIINQSYKKWELFLVDDNSLDNSRIIAERYAEIYDNIIFIHKDQNSGLSDTRNIGINKCNGKYITFIDSDDFISSDFLEILYNDIKTNNADVSCVRLYPYYENEAFAPERSKLVEVLSNTEALQKMNYQKVISNAACGKLYKIELFNDIKFPFGKLCEDLGTTYKIFNESKVITFNHNQLYYYLQRPNSIINSSFNIKRLDGLDFAEEMVDYYKNNEHIYLSAINRKFAEAYFILKKIPKRDHKDLNKKIFSVIKETRIKVLLDSKSRKHFRYLAFISLFGLSFFEFIINFQLNNFKKLFSYKFKNKIKYLISKNDIYIKYKHVKKIFVLMTADYGNLGDVAITKYQTQFLKDNFQNYKIIEVPFSKNYQNLKSVKRSLNKEDIVILSGGGFFGNLYPSAELFRQFVIRKLNKNKIISFPQSCYFTDDAAGNKMLNQAIKIYNKNKHLILLARDNKTYKYIKEMFKSDVYLVPDLVLYSKEYNTESRDNSILLMLRDDLESNITTDFKHNLILSLRRKYGYKNVVCSDTHIGNSKKTTLEYNEELNKVLEKYSKSKIVITDRLHGMIFAYITNTKCIAITNNNKKVENFYKTWFNDNKNIRLVKKEELEKIPELLKLSKNVIVNNTFDKEFKNLKEIIER